MKKLLVFVVTNVIVFAVIMYAAISNETMANMITDIAYWYDIEQYVPQICIGLTLVFSCIGYTLADVLEDLLHDLWKLIIRAYRKVSRTA